MTLGFLITSISGLLLIPRKLIPKKKEKNSMTFNDLFQNKIFWSLFFTLFTAFAAIGYIQFVYKILGNLYINDDHFLSLSGSAAFAVGGVGRVVYGFLLNKFNWRLVMIFTYAFYTLLAFSFWCSIHSKSLFLAYLLGLWWCSASFYNGIALQTNKAFPGNEWVLSYVGLAYTPAYAMPFVLEEWVTPAIGYFWTCILVAFLPTCALVITALHPEPKPRIIISSLEELNS
jgi:predicted MFS family arabinose efflux permease